MILSFKPGSISISVEKHGFVIKLFSSCRGDICVDEWLNRRLERISANISLYSRNQYTNTQGVLSREDRMKLNLDDNNALADIDLFVDDSRLAAILPFLDKRIGLDADESEVILQIFIDGDTQYPMNGEFKINDWEIHTY